MLQKEQNYAAKTAQDVVDNLEVMLRDRAPPTPTFAERLEPLTLLQRMMSWAFIFAMLRAFWDTLQGAATNTQLQGMATGAVKGAMIGAMIGLTLHLLLTALRFTGSLLKLTMVKYFTWGAVIGAVLGVLLAGWLRDTEVARAALRIGIMGGCIGFIAGVVRMGLVRRRRVRS
jgi:hypothetical protein